MTEQVSVKGCAGCRLCCSFEKYELWETPVITSELKQLIEERYPIRFVQRGGDYLFNMADRLDESTGLYKCPALDENGCILGSLRPFECRIFPYLLMSFEGRTAICISSLCGEMYRRPLSELVSELESRREDGSTLEKELYRAADEHPCYIKPYVLGYPILKVRNE